MYRNNENRISSLIRFKFHILRYKTAIFYGIILIAVVVALMEGIYPGEAALTKFIELMEQMGLQNLFTQMDLNVAGWLFWISFQVTIYIYLAISVTATFIGARSFPTSSNDTMEFIVFNNVHSMRALQFEYLISGLISVVLVLIPSAIVLVIIAMLRNASDLITRIMATFIFLSIEGLFFMSISAMCMSIWFTRSSGIKGGLLYLVAAQVFELISSIEAEYVDLRNLSINSYLDISSGLLKGNFNWDKLAIVFFLCLFFIGIALWRINKHQVLEKVGEQQKFKFTLLNFGFENKFSVKFPSFVEQIYRDRGYFQTWVLLIALYYISHLIEYGFLLEKGQFSEVLAAFDSPIFTAWTHGHLMPSSYMAILGFFAGFSVLLVSLFTIIIAANIPSTDIRTQTQDLTLTNNTSLDRIIIERTLAMAVEVVILNLIIYTIFIIMGLIGQNELDYYLIVNTYMIGIIHYVALGIFIVGVSMAVSLTKGKSVSIWLYLLFIILIFSSFTNMHLENLRNFSFIYYFDPAGILIGVSKLSDELGVNLILLVGSIIIYYIMLRYRFKHQDFVIKV